MGRFVKHVGDMYISCKYLCIRLDNSDIFLGLDPYYRIKIIDTFCLLDNNVVGFEKIG